MSDARSSRIVIAMSRRPFRMKSNVFRHNTECTPSSRGTEDEEFQVLLAARLVAAWLGQCSQVAPFPKP